jgi:hypothetical protein
MMGDVFFMRRRQNGRRKATHGLFFFVLCALRSFDSTFCEKERERVLFDDDEVLLLFQKEVWKKNKSLSSTQRKKNTKKRKEPVVVWVL